MLFHIWYHWDQTWNKTTEGSLGTLCMQGYRTDDNWRSPLDSVCCGTKPQAIWWCSCSSLCYVYHLKWWGTAYAAFSNLRVNIILMLIHQVLLLVHLSLRYAQPQHSLCPFQEWNLPSTRIEENDKCTSLVWLQFTRQCSTQGYVQATHQSTTQLYSDKQADLQIF